MIDDIEKIANAALHQRTALMAEIELLREALVDIRELVEDRADVDDGVPNLAMRVLVVVKLALREEP